MELQFTTNFSMLTEHLHILFKHYITDGRVRAPPEFQLRDMIPTFQQGAKTNRRALQSKFKSWAKRMTVLNGNLVLSSSGKIIIPQERCEEIVMELHRDDHMSINKVITQIQKKYSWTKKNFGMDLEIVMNAISNNCKNAACQKDIRKVTKTYFRKIHWVPASNVPRQFYQDSNVKYAELYNSMEILQRDGISSSEYPILQSYLSNRYNTLEALPERVKNRMSPLTKLNDNENYKKIVLAKDKHFTGLSEKNVTKHESAEPKVDISGKRNAPQSATFIGNQKNKSEALWSTLNSAKKQCFPKSLDARGENEAEKVNFLCPLSVPSAALHKNNHNFTMENDDSSRNSYSFMRSCKKPRNLHEFKKQLKDAQMYPEIYPAIFTDPKTQFLSALDLVPKRVCSKIILTKFAKEQRKKRLLEKRRSWFIGERKVLRDRNKLNKRSSHRLKMRPEAYGSLSKFHSSSFYHSSSKNSQKIRNDNFKKLKNIAKRPQRGHIEKPRMIKPKLLLPKKSPETTEKDPEIIDIASSDDESPVFQNFGDPKSEVTEPQIQSASSSKQNSSSQYEDLRLFGCDAENDEAVRNQMLYEQNFGYNGVFGAPNLFFSQNNVVNFPVASSNPSYQLNDSFYINSQTQFPILRPFLIPALSNSDIAVLQAGNFPMIRPLRPINSPNISPYFKNLQPLPKSTNSFSGQSGNSVDDEQCLFAPNGNVADGNKESSTNINPVPNQASQPPPDFKVFLVNKTPKKTYLIVPPNCTYLNTAKKIIPILDRKQPIAPRINSSEKMAIKYKSVAKELQHRRLNNALFANVNYSGKQKESKKDIESEMARLSNWISKIKSSVTPTNFHRGVEKFSHRLTSQLNVGITLVKGVRNALLEIEKSGENMEGDAV
ncbi:hypothetical protein AVEN_42211-1 [Araneus ventricosus]|uniref:Uncharacterized protein n=1 Tax=Araneus ventricosus TaxID=182803 RepID=A0A4Y2B0H6_ARAVE|nr:hypothetical protein AVEN_42211-1 [Araneus ventricosus]